MAVTSLDGRAFAKFLAAGTYFLRKYRRVVDGLNVFPVPDGDTGANMYLTARAALHGARRASGPSLAAVARATAEGGVRGARGNSGVILSQMLRGFAVNVRHREAVDTFGAAVALKDAVSHARSALSAPVEGTMLTVAQRAADEAYRLALHEPDFYRLTAAVVRAANEALERTPEQLPALKEAGVVDAGGAGLCYFMEGALRFLPDAAQRVTAFPRRPLRERVFHAEQQIGEHRFCTEFVLEPAAIEAHALRDLLAPHGDSLIVAGVAPALKVHVHTARPEQVQALAARHGSVTRLKVDDMVRQHRLLVVDAPAPRFGIAAVVPGAGFARIARELGADVTIAVPNGARPGVEDLVIGVNSSLAARVYLLPNDPGVLVPAHQAAALSEKEVVVVPSRDVVGGLAAQLALAGAAEPTPDALAALLATVRSAAVFTAERTTTVGGVTVPRGTPAAEIDGRLLAGDTLADAVTAAVGALGGADGALVTLYYGGRQRERDARRTAKLVGERCAGTTVEYYYGGQRAADYLVSVEA